MCPAAFMSHTDSATVFIIDAESERWRCCDVTFLCLCVNCQSDWRSCLVTDTTTISSLITCWKVAPLPTFDLWDIKCHRFIILSCKDIWSQSDFTTRIKSKWTTRSAAAPGASAVFTYATWKLRDMNRCLSSSLIILLIIFLIRNQKTLKRESLILWTEDRNESFGPSSRGQTFCSTNKSFVGVKNIWLIKTAANWVWLVNEWTRSSSARRWTRSKSEHVGLPLVSHPSWLGLLLVIYNTWFQRT